MSDRTLTTLVIVLIMAVLLILVFYIPRFLVRRAARKLVALMRKRGADSPSSAATLEELGLGPKKPFESLFRPRDYRPYAFRILQEANIIRVTGDGRVYLSEDELQRSPIKGFARIK